MIRFATVRKAPDLAFDKSVTNMSESAGWQTPRESPGQSMPELGVPQLDDESFRPDLDETVVLDAPVSNESPPVRIRRRPAQNWFRWGAIAAAIVVAAVAIWFVAGHRVLSLLQLKREPASPVAAGGSSINTRRSRPATPQSHAAERTSKENSPAPATAPFGLEEARRHQTDWAEFLGLPVAYENSLGMKFRLIPPGEFVMGSTPAEIEAEATQQTFGARRPIEYVTSEGPQHRVILTKPFYIGVHEVRQRDYESVVGLRPFGFTAEGQYHKDVVGLATEEFPAETISWNEAVDFCRKLDAREKLASDRPGYSLPTEAEWEFACRAGTTTTYWIGNDEKDLAKAAWYMGNQTFHPEPVGRLLANPFGLFDMHGNLWEWVQDAWEPRYYANFVEKPAIDPAGPPPSTSSLRITRGGQFGTTALRCTSGRHYVFPATYKKWLVGFRVRLSIEAVRESLEREIGDGQRRTRDFSRQ